MPVRFVCDQCGQRLSVGSRKIGSQVQCPKCRHALIVPGAKPSSSEDAPSAADSTSDAGADDDPFAALSTFEPMPVVVYDRDAESSRSSTDRQVDRRKVAVPRYAIYTQGAMLAIVAAAAFLLGVRFGGQASQIEDAERIGPFRMMGTVTYDAGDHLPAPDAGAVVILLPQEFRPAEKIDISALRPEASAPIDHPMVTVIREWGGDYAQAGADGRFELAAPVTGKYFILYLSGNAEREGERLDRKDLAEIGRYFESADELIRPTRHAWLAKRIRGDSEVSHLFR